MNAMQIVPLMPKGLSGRRLMFVLALVFFLATLALGLLLWSIRQDDLRRAEIDGANLSWVLETRLDATLRRVDADLREVVRAIAPDDLQAGRMARLSGSIDRHLADHTLKFVEITGVYIFDGKGDLRHASQPTPHFNIADRLHFRRLRDEPGLDLVFGDVQIARSTGKSALVAARAVRRDDGTLAGVVATVIDLEYFSRVLETIDLGPAGVIAIRRTEDTRLVLRRPAMPAQINQPANYAIRDRIRAGERRGVEHLQSPTDGQSRVSTFRALDDYPFYIVVAAAQEDVLAGWRRQALITLAVAAALLGMLAWLAMRLRQGEIRALASAAALHEARLQAESANMAKSRFLATMSHEVRTPLNTVLGMAQLLSDPGLDPALRTEFASSIYASGQNLLSMLNDVLDLSKIESGMLAIEARPFYPDALLGDIHTRFAPEATQKSLQFEIDNRIPADRCYASDPYRLKQMLANLVGNAIKFTEQGTVSITASEVTGDAENAVLEFSVADTGIGIDAEQRHLLFQPFSQAESSTTRRYGGAGLGLHIVRTLAELMGGEVGVDSEVGHGSRFWFRMRARRIDPARGGDTP